MLNSEIIKKIIKNNFSILENFSYKYRVQNQKIWKYFLEKKSFSLVEYSNQELNYQSLYRYEKKFLDDELSFIALYEGKPLGIFPLTFTKINDKYELSTHGSPIYAPVLADDITKETEDILVNTYLKICKSILKKIQVKKWVSCENYMDKKIISSWHEILKQQNSKIYILKEGFIDLSKSDEKIEQHLRKKKILIDINKAKKLWRTEIKHKLELDEWIKFKNLHIEVSGKQTRSDKTWLSQFNDISNNEAFAIFLFDKNKIIGGALYRYTNSVALYAIGAYDRSLYPKPISHLAHFLAIKELKKLKLKWLKMGGIPILNDYENPNDKIISIGLFKKKFCTDFFNKYIFENYID
jgi:FemAB family protein